jgi:tight adherence protein B
MGLGLFLPTFIINTMKAQRKQRMQSQLVDALMILSSSLKGGLSLLQAIEVLVEESNPPLSQEFGLVLRENKMGVSLEESLKRLNERVEIEEVRLLTNSILVSRETGGDLTKVLSRLSTTIRDNRKLKDTIRTLTLQGRLQGFIMSVLPFFFVTAVISFNRNHFDIMFESEEGRTLIFLAVGMQAVGLILIQRFSKAKF